MLDSFGLIAGQVATLIKFLKDEKTPELRFLSFFEIREIFFRLTSCYPNHLNPEQDEAVLRLTQAWISSSASHEKVPNCLSMHWG